MNIRKYFYLFILLSVPVTGSSYACSINYKPPKYINVMKIHGKKNPDIKIYEAVYAIGYEGNERFNLFSEKMELLISHQDEKICTHRPGATPACADAKGTGIDLRAIHNFETKRKLQLFIQINDGPVEPYVFKKHRVKATKEHHQHIYNDLLSICDNAEAEY